jgi:DNA sulfur modification protein DndD
MKIKSIEITNFRQFKNTNKIDFDTNGKITVILGDNGTGKTTLQQFFNWVFYDTYYFDNEINGKLYNYHLDEELSVGDDFSTVGTIEFIHNNYDYRLKRTKTFKRAHNKSLSLGESNVSMLFCDETGNWNPIPIELIEKYINEILPRALSKYFFFDGERKISDFNIKAGDTLEKAIFTMFNINIIKKAYDHIGDLSVSNSLIGQIARLKKSVKSNLDKDSAYYLNEVQKFQSRITTYESRKVKFEFDRSQCEQQITELNQKIGKSEGSAILEGLRVRNQGIIKIYLNEINNYKKNFGKALYSSTPYLLLSEKALIASKNIQYLEGNQKLVHYEGLTKDLLKDVLSKEICICGIHLNNDSEKIIKKIIDTMPPNSYKSVLYTFKTKAVRYMNEAEERKQNAEKFITTIIDYYKDIGELESTNKDLLNQMRTAEQIQKDIDLREEWLLKKKKAQEEIDYYIGEINSHSKQRDYHEKQRQIALKSEGHSKNYESQIEIARLTKKYFEQLLKDKIQDSKQQLEENIKEVYREISTTERKNVYLNNDYTLVVKNDDDSLYKSGGQDIVIMYSYIGGILRTLKKMNLDSEEGKEYPLVIDAPFSKVDGEQLGSVADSLSKVSPQVIIMTFDSDRLGTRANKEIFGKVWTILSNPSKTISEIKESKL